MSDDRCTERLCQVITDYRKAFNRNPTEIRLSPQDWDRAVRKAGYNPKWIPRHGHLLGIKAASDPTVEQGRIRLLCKSNG